MATGLLQLYTQGSHLLPQLGFLGPTLRQSCTIGLRGRVDGLGGHEEGSCRSPKSHGPPYPWDTSLDLRALSGVRPRDVPLGSG